MGETVRFGVSLDSDLLEKFDALCERQACPSRSEALRDIIRDALVQDSLHSETAEAAGVLSLMVEPVGGAVTAWQKVLHALQAPFKAACRRKMSR